jgi:hypothetical protein
VKRATAAASDDAASPFERFERFARKILAVPKKELDEKLAERKREKRKGAKR